MPQISQYTQQNIAQGAQTYAQGRQANATDMGGTVGTGMTQVGQGLGDAATAMFQIKQQEDVTDVHVKMAKAQIELENQFRDLATKAPPGTKDFQQQVGNLTQEYLSKVGEGVQTRAGQSLFANMAGNLAQNMNSKSVAFQASLDGEYAKVQYTSLLQNLGKIAFNDPTAVDAAKQQGIAAINDPNGIFSRVDAATRAKFIDAIDNDLDESTMRGIAVHQPELLLNKIAPDLMAKFKPTDRVVNAIGTNNAANYVDPSAPRGIRNNNPGNIVKTTNQWTGEVQGNDDKYKSFASPEDGIAALATNLLSYQKKGFNTVQSIINRWAPPNENDTASYVTAISKRLGVKPTDVINVSDPNVLSELTRGIIAVENGKNPYSNDQLTSGVSAALQGIRPQQQTVAPANLGAWKADQEPAKIGLAAFDRLPWQKQYEIIQTAEQRVRANQTADQQRQALADKQLREQQDNTMKQMLEDLHNDKLTPDAVLADKSLTFTQQQTMLNAISVKANKLNRTDPKVFNEVLENILKPDGDPNKVTDPQSLYDYVGHGVSFNDVKQLQDVINGKNGPDGALKGAFIKYAKSQISSTNAAGGVADPEGDKQFYEFLTVFNAAIADGQKNGKSINSMLGDPNSKDYLGPLIDRFKRSPMERIEATSRIISGGQPKPNVTPRQPGESIEDYQKRTGLK